MAAISVDTDSQFVFAFFVNNNTLYLHLGCDGPVHVMSREGTVRLQLDELGDTRVVTFTEVFQISKSGVGDIRQLWHWFQGL